MGMKLSTTRTFDYTPRLVEANRPYRMGVAGDTSKSRYWVPGVVLDQGSEGACVGFGCTAEALASPARVKFPESTGDEVARVIYRRAQKIDEWEGENYDGTSVRAGMLVGREHGWWEGFKWALNMGELRAALDLGPVVIGVEWRSGMYETWKDGQVKVYGDVVGGHCLLITGYSPNWNGWGPHYRWRNSWGREYGVNGSAYIDADELNAVLFQSGGEAAVPIGRKA